MTQLKNEHSKLAISTINLYPELVFSDEHLSDQDEFMALHHQAHAECFIANSVLTKITCQAVMKYNR